MAGESGTRSSILIRYACFPARLLKSLWQLQRWSTNSKYLSTVAQNALNLTCSMRSSKTVEKPVTKHETKHEIKYETKVDYKIKTWATLLLPRQSDDTTNYLPYWRDYKDIYKTYVNNPSSYFLFHFHACLIWPSSAQLVCSQKNVGTAFCMPSPPSVCLNRLTSFSSGSAANINLQQSIRMSIRPKRERIHCYIMRSCEKGACSDALRALTLRSEYKDKIVPTTIHKDVWKYKTWVLHAFVGIGMCGKRFKYIEFSLQLLSFAGSTSLQLQQCTKTCTRPKQSINTSQSPPSQNISKLIKFWSPLFCQADLVLSGIFSKEPKKEEHKPEPKKEEHKPEPKKEEHKPKSSAHYESDYASKESTIHYESDYARPTH